jgi:hypothetical protein
MITSIIITILMVCAWVMICNQRTYLARRSILEDSRARIDLDFEPSKFWGMMAYFESQSYNETLWRCITFRKPYKEAYEEWAQGKESK